VRPKTPCAPSPRIGRTWQVWAHMPAELCGSRQSLGRSVLALARAAVIQFAATNRCATRVYLGQVDPSRGSAGGSCCHEAASGLRAWGHRSAPAGGQKHADDIRVATDQMRVERSVMNFGRDAIGHNGLPELFVLVGDDDLSCQSWNERMWSDGIGRTSALGISSASRWLSIGGK
jgi:hypothetical protein